jgi:hypothetical protein
VQSDEVDLDTGEVRDQEPERGPSCRGMEFRSAAGAGRLLTPLLQCSASGGANWRRPTVRMFASSEKPRSSDLRAGRVAT